LYTNSTVDNLPLLPEFLLDNMDLKSGIDSYYQTSFDFLDNPYYDISLGFLDNMANPASDKRLFDRENSATNFRAERDVFLKNWNEHWLSKMFGDEYAYAAKAGLTEENRLERDTFGRIEDVPKYTVSVEDYQPGTVDFIPVNNGPDYKKLGSISFDISWDPAGEAWDLMPDGSYKDLLEYGRPLGTLKKIGRSQSSFVEDYIYNTATTRVSGFTIDAAGTGYNNGDVVNVNNPKSSGKMLQSVRAQVHRVGPNGEILSITLMPSTDPTLGGNEYLPLGGANVALDAETSVSSPAGSNATVNAIIATGQWIKVKDFLISDEIEYTLGDLLEQKRSIRDAYLKSLNEFCLATGPFIAASIRFPEFQIEKYRK